MRKKEKAKIEKTSKQLYKQFKRKMKFAVKKKYEKLNTASDGLPNNSKTVILSGDDLKNHIDMITK